MKYVASKDVRVCDLMVKYSNGSQYNLRLDKGQVLPEEMIEPGDFKKSLTFGGLKNLINHGAVLAVEDDKVDEVVRLVIANMKPSHLETQKVSEKYTKNDTYKSIEMVSQKEFSDKRDASGMVENMSMKGGKSVDVSAIEFNSVVTEKGGGLVVTSAEVTKEKADDVAHDEKGNPHHLNLSEYKTSVDFTTVKARADFDKLNHFDQLLFVKQSDNKDLLAEVSATSTKKQIQNNAKRRLEELK